MNDGSSSSPSRLGRLGGLRWLAAVTAAIAVSPLVVAAAVWYDLPDPIATHWTVSEVPDGSTPAAAFFVGAAVVIAAGAVVTAVALRRAHHDRRSQRLILLYALAGACFAAVIVGMVVAANVGAAIWTSATLSSWLLAVPLLVPAAVVAAAARLVPVPAPSGRVDPMTWGGWGYRWVPTRHATAAVVRRVPGLRLDRTDGRVFVVTVDDADRAAGLVNDYNIESVLFVT
jgi:hypothetical protein